MIAAGTLASRVTGLLRAMVLVAAVGTISQAGDAFATANQLPNSIYAVISAGLLTGVIVPQVVRVSAQEDGGHDFLAKLLTLGAVLVGAVTVVATLAAPLLVDLYSQYRPEQHALATQFAYWCLPQLFFYGMFALLGEILNARRMFAPYAWAPIVNNLVSIGGFGVFIVLFGQGRSALEGWSPAMVATLAGTATLGVIAQTVVLVLFWRRAGIPLRLDFRWRGMGLGHMGKLATWTFLTTLVGQLVGIVQALTVTPASEGGHASVAASGYAWLVYMVPYSMIILAIGTPYFTRISEHAAAERDDELKADIRQSLRVLGLFIVIAIAAVAAAAQPAARVFSEGPGEAVAVAPVLLAYLVSLLPMAVLFIVQRTFYAYGDARTPFVFTMVQGSLVLAFTLVVAATVPVENLAAAVALAQSCAGILQTVLATVLLRRRIGSLGLGGVWRALTRFALMAVPAGAAGYGVYLLSGGVGGWMLAGQLWGVLGCCLIAASAGAVYVALLALFRVPELRTALGALRRR
ncbi:MULTISPECIES: murein biosynthesis integral membrane protein MurJ [Microbacterium]|uniref:murein biosynthesis integral membrane protein MurJ n=1 Tax=Microbacterium TaxID=33882 RepID=UPI00217E18DF|nr:MULTISPECIES: murein biosynthesis integral membrane protein MurJ [Microbacterium]